MPRSTSTLRRLSDGLADLMLPAENPAGAIYGLITIGALLAAESGGHESWLDTFLSAVIAMAVYWVAHSYAYLIALLLSGGERLTPAVLLRALAHDAALIRGTSVPLLTLVAAAIVGASRESAVTAAVWSVVISLAAFELIAGLRARASRAELALETSLGVLVGLGILALMAILH